MFDLFIHIHTVVGHNSVLSWHNNIPINYYRWLTNIRFT